MRRWIALMLLLLPLTADAATWAQFQDSAGAVMGDVPFALPTGSVLHYMSTTGSDANDGLAPTVGGGHGPWATPNHTMNCGEVLLVAPGTYTNGIGVGTAANCPSSSGGIDSLGQIYFVIILCAGDLSPPPGGGCLLQLPGSAGGQYNSNLSNNNWAVEGFQCNGVTNINYCFLADTGANNRITHHSAYINNIAYDSAQGFGINGCPGGCTHNIPGEGSDYVAFVGNIAKNSAQANCLGAFDIVAPGVFDQAAGTHHIIYGNFSYKNLGACPSDGTGLYFDTWDAHGAAYQGVIANNITWNNERYGINLTHSGDHITFVSNILYHNNTFYSNCQGNYPQSNDFFCGSAFLSVCGTCFSTNMPYTGVINKNIGLETLATMDGLAGNGPVYAMAAQGRWPSLVIGGTGVENIFKGVRTSCTAAVCDAGFNVAENDGNALGTNIYTDPLFANTTDLINNRSGTPNCSGFLSVTACMGWNATTGVLTTPSVISDLQASCAQCAGKGYQLPSTTCTANAEYPTYLKGIVYLHAVNGFTAGTPIVQKPDLVTRPCGM